MVSVYTELLSTTDQQNNNKINKPINNNNTTDENNNNNIINDDSLITTQQPEHSDVETTNLYNTQIDSEQACIPSHNSLPSTKHNISHLPSTPVANNTTNDINDLQLEQQERG
eukprot:UN08020